MYRFIIELLKITKNVYYHIGDFQLSLMALNSPYGYPLIFLCLLWMNIIYVNGLPTPGVSRILLRCPSSISHSASLESLHWLDAAAMIIFASIISRPSRLL